MKTDIENFDIQNFLPHRPPMLMVNKLLLLTQTKVSSTFKIEKNCVFVDDNNFFKESGLIENNAQTCSAIVGQNFFDDDDVEGKGNKVVGFISTIKTAKIYALPKVDDTIITKASLISRFDTEEYTMCTMQTSTFNNEELIVDCTMNLIIQEV
ncbi:flexirubin biosynthesis protein [Patiriisocius marinistellae]|uniref:Flexirubin biosynthesis protein n=1 Tax=Patiriisocius marinistellae TaxID=2494560 RepID=A0A5J4FYN4_9FLAO|nr:ABC transporter permease [Patiriisocius marinistellae]GEQ85226.1 flexirubin biosynthesis protein [Patiriisocius marinistellae]